MAGIGVLEQRCSNPEIKTGGGYEEAGEGVGAGGVWEFLLRRQIVPERNAKFYVGWIRRYLGQPVDPAKSQEERVEEFIERLREEGRWEDWQIEQARRAIGVYFHAYLDGRAEASPPVARVEVDRAGQVDTREVLAAARDLLGVAGHGAGGHAGRVPRGRALANNQRRGRT